MAAEQTSTSQQTDQQGQSQQSQPGYSQNQFDQVFGQITGQTGQSGQSAEIVREWSRAFFRQAVQSLQTAQEVTELQTLHLMKQEIVADVCQQVIATLQKNPQLVQPQR